MEEIKAYSKAAVPFYSALEDYEWVSDYLQCEEIKKSINALRKQKKKIREKFPAKSDLVEKLKTSFEQFQERRRIFLARYIGKRGRSNDPFFRLEYDPIAREHLSVNFSWADVEAATKLLADDGQTVEEAEREKFLSAIDKKIEKLKSDLQKASPQGYFMLKGAGVSCDAREEFVKHWFNIQSKCNGPCSPQGFALQDSPDIEKRAYEALGIPRAINRGPQGYYPKPKK